MAKKHKKDTSAIVLVACAVAAAIMSTVGLVYFFAHPELKSSAKDTATYTKNWRNQGSLKTDQANQTVSQTSEGMVTIDFAACTQGYDSFSYAFGSTHFYFDGVQDGYCHFYMGSETENPSRDGKLKTECSVPTTYTKTYPVGSSGADFSFIDTYCKTAEEDRSITV